MKEMLFTNIQELFEFLEKEYGQNWHDKIMVNMAENTEKKVKDGKALIKVRIYDLNEMSENVSMEELNASLKENSIIEEEKDEEFVEIPEEPRIEIDVSENNMKAYLTIYPGTKREMPTLEEIQHSLEKRGIVYGIKRDEISRILKDKCVLKAVLVAEGKAPTPPKAAQFKLLFPPNGMKLKTKENEKVDYASMYEIAYCQKGDKLVEKTPAMEGKKGCDLFGRDLPAEKAKDIDLRRLIGKNVELSEDKTAIISSIDGQPFFSEDGKVNVNEMFIVHGNLKYDIGNIDFPGTVWIKGNVEEEFNIKSGKDVLIDGIVGEANIEAGGAILVKGGVFGKRKGLLISHGDFKAKFLSEVTVISHGNVEIDEYIMNSRVLSRGNVVVKGKGWVIGGSVKAYLDVILNVMGSISKVQTHISAGINFEFSKKEEELEKGLQRCLTKVGDISVAINKILASFKEAKYGEKKKQLLIMLSGLRKEKLALLKKMQNLREKLRILNLSRGWEKGRKSSKVIIKQTCFEGSRITINDETIVIHTDIGPTIFSYDNISKKILATPYKNWN
ncbi:DUF342 domain-containing protein [Mesoaciditoga lauensis]|uniref:DUF342 domain-containing protein n=1 Tax=Mesoaciditoga lauensis TaxID=1495039 RepID=UPI00056D67FF|nr:FapA family protein [Mesoaciditoga lauensis]